MLRSPLFLALGITVVVSTLILWARAAGTLEDLELLAYDWSIRWQPYDREPHPGIVLITISEEDLQRLERWPLSDEALAELLEKVALKNPLAIGLDIYRNFQVPPGLDRLNDVLTRHAEIFAVMKFPGKSGEGIPGPSVLVGTDRIGFNDVLPDPGGTVRRALLFLDDGERTKVSFSLMLALHYLNKQKIRPLPDAEHPEYLRLGNVTIPPFSSNVGGYVGADDRGYQTLVRYHRASPPFQNVSLEAVLSDAIGPHVFTGKIVLIGLTAESVKDYFYTPYSVGLTTRQQIPGIEFHAHLVAQFLRSALNGEEPIRSWPDAGEGVWIVLWCVIGGAIGLWVRALWSFVALIGCMVGILAFGGLWALEQGWWIPVIPPVLGFVATGGLVTVSMRRRERHERTLLMDIFSRHVSAQVADAIWKDREQFLHNGRLKPRKQMVTVLFADLQNFTRVAENLTPQDLMEWLNMYMEVIAGKIMAYGGVVDDYFGDGVKADFGVPFARTRESEIREDAQHAVLCALAMREEINRLNKDWQSRGFPQAALRIGIHTGTVVAGSLGSARRLKYTTIGDTVNVAARLENWAKDEWERKMGKDPCRILIGHTTREYLGARWPTEEVGALQLKGKAQLVKVYRVLASSNGQ